MASSALRVTRAPAARSAEEPIPQRDALRLYLAMLAGADRTGYLEVRWRLPTGGMGQRFHQITRPDLAEEIRRLSRGTDVYVGCAPRTRRHGGIDAIANVYALWVDCDGAEAVVALEMFEPAPSVVIRSGSPDCVHAYWQLDRPLSAADAKRGNRRLAHHLGADARATDAARILRPPGTLNHKSSPPAPVACESLQVVSYNPMDVAGHLPDPEPPVPARTAPRSIVDADDPLLEIPAATYFPALAGLRPDRAGKVACPFHDDRTPSLHLYGPGPDGADRGWYCHGCDVGGGIYQLAALLWGHDLPPGGLRGPAFLTVQTRLLDLFIAKPELLGAAA